MRSQILFGLLAVICALWLIVPSHKESQISFRAEKHPEEYMSNISLKTYTDEGVLKNEMKADYWAYLPEQQSSQLTIPHLTVYKPNQTIWHIDAKNGKISQPTLGSITEVELRDNVVIRRPATSSTVPILLETTVVRYKPKSAYAETDEFVTVSKPDLTVTGTGMRAFLDRGFVELLHNVKTYYVAKKDQKFTR